MRLIDADAIFPNGVFYVNGSDPMTSLDELINRINNAPTVDAIVPPCKIGSTIYMIVTKRHKISLPEFSFIKQTHMTELNFFRVCRTFGKTVFLTREEAEAALAERMKNNA